MLLPPNIAASVAPQPSDRLQAVTSTRRPGSWPCVPNPVPVRRAHCVPFRISATRKLPVAPTATADRQDLNAAWLAQRLGSDRVVSVEVDPALAEQAAQNNAAVGLSPRIVEGDGCQGWPEGAPYQRIIATYAFDEIPFAWVALDRERDELHLVGVEHAYGTAAQDGAAGDKADRAGATEARPDSRTGPVWGTSAQRDPPQRFVRRSHEQTPAPRGRPVPARDAGGSEAGREERGPNAVRAERPGQGIPSVRTRPLGPGKPGPRRPVRKPLLCVRLPGSAYSVRIGADEPLCRRVSAAPSGAGELSQCRYPRRLRPRPPTRPSWRSRRSATPPRWRRRTPAPSALSSSNGCGCWKRAHTSTSTRGTP
ncbi:hypothetical protein [Streptomyces microflavus]|uniref:hypothetical protein n=1 Tax=Streptomyces microflavus TaxID=1919 RepID=UPI002D7EC472|nr:hypothetical protein [Streptomyces microflavus]